MNPMTHTEDSEMYEPHEVSRYPIDPNRARKKAAHYAAVESQPLRIRAIEVSETVGETKRTTRYEFEGGEPVEVWRNFEDGHLYVIPTRDVVAGRFPWLHEDWPNAAR